MRYAAALLVCLCLSGWSSLTLAQEYASQTAVSLGKLVVLTAKPADSTVWAVVNPPTDNNHQVCDGGGKLFFSTGVAGNYVIVESSYSANGDAADTHLVLLHSVTVGTPGPGPNPTPPQPNPLPPGRFGLAEFVRQSVLSTPGIERKLAAQLGSDFGVIASQIAAGTITTFADANAKVKARTQETRKGVEDAWKPVTAAIGVKLNELVTSKKLTTTDMKAVQAVFEEVRDGFLAAAQ